MGILFPLGVGIVVGNLFARYQRDPKEEEGMMKTYDITSTIIALLLMVIGHYAG